MSVNPNPEVTSDDRLWGLLSYLLTPIVPIIILLMEDKKNRPFLRAHVFQALGLGVVEAVLAIIISFIPVIGCFSPIMWIINIIYALKANKGEIFEIPVITSFMKGQGWA
jgi:uncharacterized protein